MTLRDELWDLVEHTPEGVTTVTLEVDWLRRQLEVDTASESGEGRDGADTFLTTSEAGRRLGVEPRTVRAGVARSGYRTPSRLERRARGSGEYRALTYRKDQPRSTRTMTGA